jgi:hypothetical protein
VQVDLASHAIAGTIISEPGHVDLADAPDLELECVSLPHAFNMVPLEPFASRLWLYLNANEKSMFFENAMTPSACHSVPAPAAALARSSHHASHRARRCLFLHVLRSVTRSHPLARAAAADPALVQTCRDWVYSNRFPHKSPGQFDTIFL